MKKIFHDVRIRRFCLIVAILGLSFGVYANTFQNEFVNWDDLNLIVNNSVIRSLAPSNVRDMFIPGVLDAYQPVRTLSYAVDFHFWGLNPIGYHLSNIICNTLSVLFIYLIARRLAQSFVFACLAASMFAVHPVHVEAVTWLSGRRDVLSLLFALCSFYSFLRFKTGSPDSTKGASSSARLLWYALSLLTFCLGLLTKSAIIILPGLFLLYEICFLPGFYRRWKRLILCYLPFLSFALLFLSAFLSVSRDSGVLKASYHGESMYITFLTMLRVLAEYIGMLVIPIELSATYGVRIVTTWLDPPLVPAFILHALMLGLCIISWKKARIVCFGIVWFYFALLPVSNIIPIGIIKADRYLYLPSVGFCLVFAWGATYCWNVMTGSKQNHSLLHWGYWILLGVLFASFGMMTIHRNRAWKDSYTLWMATLDTTPDSTIALDGLGNYYMGQYRFDKVIEIAQQVIDNYQSYPFYHYIESTYYQLGRAYMAQREYAKAAEVFDTAITLNPDFRKAYSGLAEVKIRQRDFEAADALLQKELEIDPENHFVYEQLGNLAFMRKQYAEAVTQYQKAIDLSPLYMIPYNGLGLSYAAQEELEKAVDVFQLALSLKGEAVFLQKSLGSVYWRQGKLHEALALFSDVLEHEPGNRVLRKRIAELYLEVDRPQQAAEEFETLLQQQADDPESLSGLGVAYARQNRFEDARNAFRAALELDPAFLQTTIMLGDLCLEHGDVDCATNAYRHALKLEPDAPEIRKKLQALRGRE